MSALACTAGEKPRTRGEEVGAALRQAPDGALVPLQRLLEPVGHMPHVNDALLRPDRLRARKEPVIKDENSLDGGARLDHVHALKVLLPGPQPHPPVARPREELLARLGHVQARHSRRVARQLGLLRRKRARTTPAAPAARAPPAPAAPRVVVPAAAPAAPAPSPAAAAAAAAKAAAAAARGGVAKAAAAPAAVAAGGPAAAVPPAAARGGGGGAREGGHGGCTGGEQGRARLRAEFCCWLLVCWARAAVRM